MLLINMFNLRLSNRPILVFILFTLSISLIPSCSKSKKSKLPACTSENLFTEPAVPLTAISHLDVIGSLAPVGGSPLPKSHTAYLMNTLNVPVTASGAFTISRISVTTYVASPTRQGFTDHSLSFDVCAEVSGDYAHISTLSEELSGQFNADANCSEYNTVDETIRTCGSEVNIKVTAGTPLGVTATAAHTQNLDIGMRDSRLVDYANPSRYMDDGRGALCPWDFFIPSVKASLYPLISGTGTPPATESPECGTMAVDVAGTAKGRWTPQANPADGSDPTSGDFFVLVSNPNFPESEIAISTRIAALNTSSLSTFPVDLSSRLNVNPSDITANGTIYCYDENLASSTYSYFVQLISAGNLRVEKFDHLAGSSICNTAPTSWAFTSSAIDLIR